MTHDSTFTVTFFDGKKTTSVLGRRHKPLRYASLFIRLTKPGYCITTSIKKGNSEGTMGSKSNPKIMKANRILKNGTAQKKSKKENAQDIISKSIQGGCEEKIRTIEKIYDEKLGFTIGYSTGSKSKTKPHEIVSNP